MGEKVLRTFVANPQNDLQTLKCYRLNKIFMRMIGQWPFSPIWQQRLGLIIFICGIGNLYSLEVINAIESRNDLDKLIACFAPLAVNTAGFVKLGTLFIGAKAVRELFTRMQNDWNTRTTEAEKRILQKYANNSEYLTRAYMYYMYFTMFAYLLMPTVPMALNIVKPLNESRPKELPSHAEYFIEEPTQHYLPLFLHQSLCTFCTVSTVIVCDSMYVTYVQHACGIFAVLNHRLENLVNEEYDDDDDLYSVRKDSTVFQKIINCIEEHQKAIKFAEFIENMYYVSNLIQMMLNMLVISVTGVQTVIKLGHNEEVIRYSTFTIGVLIHLLYNSLPGQALRDHSTLAFYSAYDYSYSCKWYLISKRSKDLLKLIMLRSLTPCQLTAGKLYVMNLERFTAVVQTSVSYFTVLTSMR